MSRLTWPTTRSPLTVVGLMSGTSLDGIDAALIEVARAPHGVNVRPLALYARPYDTDERTRLAALTHPNAPVEAICAANFDLGEWFAQAALAVLKQAELPASACDLIASHGQTVWHISGHSTLQIGSAAVIAERTGLPIVSNFRAREIAAGGQGAPLVSYVDYLLFRDPHHGRAVQNLGGIGNVTWLPAGNSPEQVIAFDTGPGNMVIDGVTQLALGRTRDHSGSVAATGHVSIRLLDELLADPFFRLPPPKTTGREKFGAAYAHALVQRGQALGLTAADLVATATMLTVRSIQDAYRTYLPHVSEVILGGGGVHNVTLVRWLQEALRPAVVRTSADFGIDVDFKEAIAFAVLGAETVWGNPGNLPAATGARRPVILGDITPGD